MAPRSAQKTTAIRFSLVVYANLFTGAQTEIGNGILQATILHISKLAAEG
jgi:hypothetical protein